MLVESWHPNLTAEIWLPGTVRSASPGPQGLVVIAIDRDGETIVHQSDLGVKVKPINDVWRQK